MLYETLHLESRCVGAGHAHHTSLVAGYVRRRGLDRLKVPVHVPLAAQRNCEQQRSETQMTVTRYIAESRRTAK